MFEWQWQWLLLLVVLVAVPYQQTHLVHGTYRRTTGTDGLSGEQSWVYQNVLATSSRASCRKLSEHKRFIIALSIECRQWSIEQIVRKANWCMRARFKVTSCYRNLCDEFGIQKEDTKIKVILFRRRVLAINPILLWCDFRNTSSFFKTIKERLRHFVAVQWFVGNLKTLWNNLQIAWN